MSDKLSREELLIMVAITAFFIGLMIGIAIR